MPRSPLCIYPDRAVLLPMRLAGSIAHYARIAAHGQAYIDLGARYNKRDKATHRYDICDTHGRLQLTVPVSIGEHREEGASRPLMELAHRPLTVADISVSPHCEWWRMHVTALESAYGRTPYFDYYIDSLLPIIYMRRDNPEVKLWRLCQSMDQRICEILGIEEPIYTNALPEGSNGKAGLRPAVMPSPSPSLFPAPGDEPPYWQVRADKHGFMPGLSILDLIFSLGPEAPLYMQKLLSC